MMKVVSLSGSGKSWNKETFADEYEKNREDFIKSINGGFSFVLYDEERNEYIWGRDRFGCVPLYYSVSGGRPEFSDSIKSLLSAEERTGKFRKEMLEIYLSYSYMPGEDTFFEGIYKALPGYIYTFINGIVKKKRYFTPAYDIDNTRTAEEWSEEVSLVLDDIFDGSEKGIHSLLSSGVDSNYLCRRLRAADTYTAAYDDLNCSESREAELISEEIGARHHSVHISPEEIMEAVPKTMEALEQPTADVSAVVLMVLSAEISKKTDRCYSGEGIDELFMGYHYYDVNEIAENMSLREAEYLGCIQGMTEEIKRRIFRNYSKSNKMKYVAEAFSLCRGESRMNQAAMVDMLVWLNGNLLPNVYCTGKATGLKTEMPYIDNRLYDISLRIPDKYKYAGQDTKMVFRKAAEKYLSNNQAMRTKRGFPVPITGWLKTEKYIEKVRATFASDVAAAFFNIDELLTLYDKFIEDRNGMESWRPIWCIFCFIVWYKRMVEDTTSGINV